MPSRPFGNDFIVETPSLDRLEERLYQQGRQEELFRQKQAQNLDDQFSRNVANIRDADVNDYTRAYQDWKNASKALLRNKNISGPEYTQAQMEVNRKLSDIYKIANQSKQQRQQEEDLAKRIMMKPDDFNDDAYDLLIRGRGTPVNGLKTYQYLGADGKPVVKDLTDLGNYLYQDKTNYQPILQKAAGTIIPRGTPSEKLLPGGLETEITSYKGGNDPVTFYKSLVGSFTNARSARNLASRYSFTPEEAQEIVTRFSDLQKDPVFKNAYGDIKFPEGADLTEGTRTAKLLAMQYALNNPPVTMAPVRKKNVEAVMKANQDFQKAQLERRHQNSMQRIRLIFGLNQSKPMSPESISNGIDELINSHIKSSDENNGILDVDAETYKAITGVPMTKNSYLTVDSYGNYRYGRKNPDTGQIENLKDVPRLLVKGKLLEAFPKTSPTNQTTPSTKPPIPKPSNKKKITW